MAQQIFLVGQQNFNCKPGDIRNFSRFLRSGSTFSGNVVILFMTNERILQKRDLKVKIKRRRRTNFERAVETSSFLRFARFDEVDLFELDAEVEKQRKGFHQDFQIKN